MAHDIAAVLFDIGGVLVALDGVPTLSRLLGVAPDHDALHARWLASPAVVAHETGVIDAPTFAARVVSDLRLPVAAEAFLQDFCNWPTGLLPGAIELLDDIPDRHQVAALSNSCAVHWEKIRSMGLTDRLDKTFLSHEIDALKPSVKAFRTALEGLGLSPSRVLFLDDGARNVEAAAQLGMHAFVVRGPAQARCVLSRYGIVAPSAPPR
jgi:putative hydrolase of the HAD superfamily